ncbi:MAG: cytochrome c oxidase subunit II [Amphiplicatus sp.]
MRVKRDAMNKKMIAGLTGLASLWGAEGALAQGAVDGHIAMQPANSALAEQVHFFHNIILMPIITVISLLVLALLLWIVVRYNSKANPVARKFSHNTLIEIIWTGVPILILLAIALPSFELLYAEDVIPDGKEVVIEGDGGTTEFAFANDFPESRRVTRARQIQVLVSDASGIKALERGSDYTLEGLGDTTVKVALATAPAAGSSLHIRGGRSVDTRGDIVLAPSLTIKAIGSQWQWSYAYPDFGDFEYVSSMLPEGQTTPELYRLAVDNNVLVPVGETVRIVTTAKDVIHSWAMPAFAIKIDAVPGRLNETWFRADREGVYYGQCSEICGVKHAFMPIAVEVVSRPAFEAWVDEQRALAGLDPMFGDDAVKYAQAPANAAANQ